MPGAGLDQRRHTLGRKTVPGQHLARGVEFVKIQFPLQHAELGPGALAGVVLAAKTIGQSCRVPLGQPAVAHQLAWHLARRLRLEAGHRVVALSRGSTFSAI